MTIATKTVLVNALEQARFLYRVAGSNAERVALAVLEKRATVRQAEDALTDVERATQELRQAVLAVTAQIGDDQ